MNNDKLLAKLTKRRTNTWINKLTGGKGDVTTDTNEIHKIIQEYFENLYSTKVENDEEIDKFLDTYVPPKLNQLDINNLNKEWDWDSYKETPNKEKPRSTWIHCWILPEN
jgi:hypothetical protein